MLDSADIAYLTETPMAITDFRVLRATSIYELQKLITAAIAASFQPTLGAAIRPDGDGFLSFTMEARSPVLAGVTALKLVTARSLDKLQVEVLAHLAAGYQPMPYANVQADNDGFVCLPMYLGSFGANPGTAATGITAQEFGDGFVQTTVLTVSTVLPAIAGGASLGVGKLAYTFPAGIILVEAAYMSLGITQTQGNINADTPDIGLGTVIASGAVAVLGGTATFENLITGQTAANCTGTATVAAGVPTAGVPLLIPAASAHTVHINVADGWAASGDAAALLAGTVRLSWRFLG